MARILAVCACLLAIVTMAGAMPGQALVEEVPDFTLDGAILSAIPPGSALWSGLAADVDLADAAGSGPACSKAGDGQGVGGSQASCKFSCGPAALVAVGVKGNDPQAGTFGNASCDTADASCALPTPACADVSDDVSEKAARGSCSGSTDEFFDSPVVVACVATVPGPDIDPKSAAEDAMQALCDYADVCPEDGGPIVCVDGDRCGLWNKLCGRLAWVHSCDEPLVVPCVDCIEITGLDCETVLAAAGDAGARLQAALDQFQVGDAFTAILSDSTATAAFVLEPDAACSFELAQG